jgi:hypothetical protein
MEMDVRETKGIREKLHRLLEDPQVASSTKRYVCVATAQYVNLMCNAVEALDGRVPESQQVGAILRMLEVMRAFLDDVEQLATEHGVS